MATEEGIVIKLGSGSAWVKTTRSSACKSCSSRESCQASEQGKAMEVEAANPVDAKIGDRILLYFETSSLLKAAFLLYIFPVLCMLGGAALGHWLSLNYSLNTSLGSAAAGFGCLALSFMLVKKRGDKMALKDSYKPRIIRILRNLPAMEKEAHKTVTG
ncbi:MAG: SoxR reducing system RseC family protein [Deltaproteobacteria bacterium]|jgi:sigma-E factor negative regulatory protein RseC|nr:SoxR reducing system RseC family protein [Deltaproteobacteria bacterium]